jgi:hypothetical protein
MSGYYDNETLCPCCGSTLPASAQLRVHSLGQFAIRKNRRAYLTKTELRIRQALRAATVPLDARRLAERVYFDDPQGGPDNYNSVKCTLTKLRKKLAPLGVRIERYLLVQH